MDVFIQYTLSTAFIGTHNDMNNMIWITYEDITKEMHDISNDQ